MFTLLKEYIFRLVVLSIPLISLSEIIYGYKINNVSYMLNGLCCLQLVLNFFYNFLTLPYFYISYLILLVGTCVNYSLFSWYVLVPNFIYLIYGLGAIYHPLGSILLF
jgi:hypothetical protein